MTISEEELNDMAPQWNPADYTGAAKSFVAELLRLADEYSNYVSLRKEREDQPGLMIRDKNSTLALMEYRPGENRLFARPERYEQLSKRIPVPRELVDSFHSDIQLYGKNVHDPKIFIDHLKRILNALYLENKSDDKSEPPAVAGVGSKSSNNMGSAYLPTRIDCEAAYSQLAEEGDSLEINSLLDQIQNNMEEMGKNLHPQWRSLTKKNIAIWLNSAER